MDDYERGLRDSVKLFMAMSRFKGAITFKDFYNEMEDYIDQMRRDKERPLYDRVDAQGNVLEEIKGGIGKPHCAGCPD
jgi:hypothetical protein